MKICVLFSLSAVLLLGCPPSPNPPGPDSDATVPITPGPWPFEDELDGASPAKACAAMCTNLDRLGCGEAHPEVGTCEDLCVRVQSKHLVDLHPACVAKASTVVGVQLCGEQVKCAQK